MRSLLILCLSITAINVMAAEYTDIRPFISPCARDFFMTALKAGGPAGVRNQVRDRCRNGGAKDCPDLWLVYSHTEIILKGPDALTVSKEAIRRLPNSAAAHYYHVFALGLDAANGGVFHALFQIGATRKALERVLQLDPDCNEARYMLAGFYTAPGLLGGNADKLKHHLAELDRREPYYAALAHGKAAEANEDYTAAASYFEEAQRLKPDQAAPGNELLKLDITMGNYEKAFAACLSTKSVSSTNNTKDKMLVELSARSGLHSEEALTASTRYLSVTNQIIPYERADVMINTAIILKRIGRNVDAEKLIAEAKKHWSPAKLAFLSREKSYRPKAAPVATR